MSVIEMEKNKQERSKYVKEATCGKRGVTDRYTLCIGLELAPFWKEVAFKAAWDAGKCVL